MNEQLTNTGHGHVFPRPDGVKARCGGPFICDVCAKDLARKNATIEHEHEPLKFGTSGEYPGYKTTCHMCGLPMELEWDANHDQRNVIQAGIWAARYGRVQGKIDALQTHIASLPDRWKQTDLDGSTILYWNIPNEWIEGLKEMVG